MIAGEPARFDPRWLDVGIHPGGGHLWRLIQRIGTQGAAALVLCGDTLTGAEAVPPAWPGVAYPMRSACRRLQARHASRGPVPAELVARTKESLAPDSRSRDAPEHAMALELEAQEWSMDQPEFPDAVKQIQAAIAARSNS